MKNPTKTKNSITTSLRRSLACGVSAAMLLNAAQTLADVDAGDTYNQSVPIGTTQRTHGINQPSSFGTTPSDDTLQQENRAADATDQPDASESGMASDNNQQPEDAATRGALVDNAEGSRQIQINTGDNQTQSLMANALLERKLVNLKNKEIGDIEEVVQGQDGTPSLVVEAGGFMGIGEKEILVPLNEVRLSGSKLIWETEKGASELKDAEEYRYDENLYSTVADD